MGCDSDQSIKMSSRNLSHEEVGKGWGTFCAHGHSPSLFIEVVMKSKGVFRDDHLQEVPQHVLDFEILGGRRWGGDYPLQDHLDGSSLWDRSVKRLDIQ